MDKRTRNEARRAVANDAAMLALALALEPVAPSSRLNDRLRASLARRGRYGVFAVRVARLFDIELDAASETLRSLEDPAAWGPGLLDGVGLIPVVAGPRFAGAVATFSRFQPGVRFPHHAHVGDEVTIVLDGAYKDSRGRVVARGDEAYEPAGSDHDFVVLDLGECIAAAIVVGGIELT